MDRDSRSASGRAELEQSWRSRADRPLAPSLRSSKQKRHERSEANDVEGGSCLPGINLYATGLAALEVYIAENTKMPLMGKATRPIQQLKQSGESDTSSRAMRGRGLGEPQEAKQEASSPRPSKPATRALNHHSYSTQRKKRKKKGGR